MSGKEGAAQHDPMMYMLYEVPESNLLNPAISLACPWYVGLPALSSVHANYGNSLFTYNQLFTKQATGERRIEAEKIIGRMHRRDLLGAEAHLQLLALGHRWGKNSFYFTITEKEDLPLTLPAEGVQLLWNGNTPYEGKKAGLEGTGAYLKHYREYAVTWSHEGWNGIYFGVRGKLLFGKLDLSTTRNHLNVTTDARTFNLLFRGDVRVNTSLPVEVVTNPDGSLNDLVLRDDVTVGQLLFNGRNPGLAVDAGVIVPYGERWTFSASLLDVGFIRWRSYLNNMTGRGAMVYRGIDQLPQGGESYFNDLIDALVNSFHVRYVQEAYTTWLPPRLLGGASYQVNDRLIAGVQGEMQVLPTKLVSSVTLTGQYSPVKRVSLLLGYTAQYNSVMSLGGGLVLGGDPVQFYIVSADVPGLIRPLETRNVNVRFGFNLLLGCREKRGAEGKNGQEGGSRGLHQSRERGNTSSPVRFRPSRHCYSGMPVKEKAYKKKIRKRKR